MLLEGEQRLLEGGAVGVGACDGAGGVGGEEVVEARGEEVDGAVAHAYAGRVVEVDVGRGEELLELLLEPRGVCGHG